MRVMQQIRSKKGVIITRSICFPRLARHGLREDHIVLAQCPSCYETSNQKHVRES